MAKYGSGRYGSSVYGPMAAHPFAGVTGKLMWLVQVDWDRDGSFGSQIEPQDILRLQVWRGRVGTMRRMRTDGTGQLQTANERFEVVIRDSARRYDCFYLSSPLYGQLGAPGYALRVLLVDGTGKMPAEPVFVGMLTQVEYDHQSGCATLLGCGLAGLLRLGDAAAVFSPCQSFSANAWSPYFMRDAGTPYPFNYWKGRPGGLGLHACALLVLERAGWKFGMQAGQMAGGAVAQPDFFFMDGLSAWDALTELADAFAGRLFFRRDGSLFVMHPEETGVPYADAPAPTRAQMGSGLMRGSPFEGLYNRVELQVRAHSVPLFVTGWPAGYADMVAWSNAGPVPVPPNSEVRMEVRYALGAIGAGRPLQGSWVYKNDYDPALDASPYVAWSAPDKSGTKLSGSYATFDIQMQLSGYGPYGPIYVQNGNRQNSCTIRLANYHPTLTAYFFNLLIRVIGVRETGEALLYVQEDAPSIALNGLRVAQMNNRWVQNGEMAAQAGDFYLQALADRQKASPARVVYQWSGTALYQALLMYDLGRVVDFGAPGLSAAEANFGLSGRWLVIGQELGWLGEDGQHGLVTLVFEKI